MTCRYAVSAILAATVVGTAHADDAPDANDADQLQTITVTASKLRSMEQFTPTASRLGLSARDTPATLDTVDADEIIGRGLHSVEMAVDTMPGVISGGSPGDPAELSMRGFTGNQITVLFNGLYIGPSNFVNRPGNSFNLASVEILKGPASMLYGQGAVGGVVNAVSKGPSFDKSEAEFLGSYGQFGTTDFGVGGGTHFGDTLAVRADISRTSTDGFVRGAKADSLNGTTSVLWRPITGLEVQLSFDYLTDHPSPYWGTPLVPLASATRAMTGAIDPAGGLTTDERMRFVNYNVSDYDIRSSQYWPQLLVKWSPSENLTLENHTYYFHAMRKWYDSESYSYNPDTQLVDRDRFFIAHNQELFGDQGSATYSHDLLGMKNKLVVGFDYSHLHFLRTRGGGDGDSVDPFSPDRGTFGPLQTRLSPTRWDDWGGFFEDVLSVTDKLRLVTGGRYDTFSLDRQNFNYDGSFNASSSFKRTFKFGSGRVGVVYDITPNLTPYASITSAKDPGGSGLFIVNAGQNFGLSNSYQGELGIKGSTPSHQADFTLATYYIKRQNILTQETVDTIATIGSQTSKGLELTADVKVTPDWVVSANGAFTDSYYGSFVDPSTGLDATGQQPPNVPRWTANVWTSYRNIAGLPLEAGAGARFIGNRPGNQTDTLLLKEYTLVNFYVSYQLDKNLLLSARVNNALNKAYVNWADINYPSEVILGEPRSYEVSVFGKF